ncbi:septal ring lytic transglycosylase RlpA family protein [Tsuneonella mangrovi]|uniref:septal ring lytic transglycosylase RlpA family protein n=1 Tax=Tsuneonella mangrovi TaxID=1982042 RepID=UPI000BA202C2|nr:septal ring lytic transglycosylase RlpA family protein [Tsuneonella mangrovi]
MDGTGIKRRRATLRTLALAAALAIPASVSSPVLADDAADAFAASFDTVPAPRLTVIPSAKAVDLSTFQPPIEGQADDSATGEDLGTGVASYYGRKFNGRSTASGERFDMNAMTAAHKTLPFGSRVRVTNLSNGKSVVVRINDRGPYVKGRTIDLSRAAATEIGLVGHGHTQVELALLDD